MFRLLIIVGLALLLGCGGPSVTFPEPRVAVDDEAPTSQPAPPKPKTTPQRPPAVANRTAKPAASALSPQTRADAVNDAATRAMQGLPRDEDDRPVRLAPRTDDEPTGAMRPKDLAAWTNNDFRSAKQDRDVRLVQAVALLGRSGDNATANARLLVELLDPPVSTNAPASASRLSAAMHGLPQAIVTALAANPSDVARDALKEVLLGKLQTNLDDRAFTLAAIKAIVENGGSDAEAIIHAILTMPEAIRPPGRGDFTAEALQKECANLVRLSASPQLRLRLAQHVANPATSATHRTALLPMLLEQRGENVPAQAALALSENFDAHQRTTIQRQMLVQLRRTIDTLMYAPDTPLLHGDDDAAVRAVFATRRPAQMEETVRVSGELWTQAFVKRLADRLSEAELATDQADLFALATSVPSDTLRPVVNQHLQEHWLEGASLVTTPQFTPSTMRDPGMLLVLKTLPRENPNSRQAANRARGNSAQQQRMAQERKARQAWNGAVYTMVITLMRRCEVGGEVSRIAARQIPHAQASQPVESVADLDRLLQQPKASPAPIGDNSATTGRPAAMDFPLELPPGADIESSHALRWPDQLDGQIHASVSPLTIHYARLRFEDQGQRAVAFFARQLKGAVERPLENGRWLDSDSRPAPGKFRSVDVMINRARLAAPLANRNSVEELAAEILWIEINDFVPEPTVARK